MNSRFYLLLSVLLILTNTSFVVAADNEIKNKDVKNVMPPAPSGPYRSQTRNEQVKNIKGLAQDSKIKQSPAVQQVPAVNFNRNSTLAMPTPRMAQRPPQQPMPAPNWNRNRMKAPQMVQRPRQQPMPAPNWNRNRMQPPQWVQRPRQQPMPAPNWNDNKSVNPMQVPEWVKNPPIGPKPPAWVTNPRFRPQYGYRDQAGKK